MTNVDTALINRPPSRSARLTRFEIRGIWRPHPLNKGDALVPCFAWSSMIGLGLPKGNKDIKESMSIII